MTRSLTRTQALLLGLVVLAGLGLGGWALFHIGQRQRLWTETVELRAGFSSANGIDKGTPVRIRGVEAGQVVAVDLPVEGNPDGKVFLRLQIDKKFLPLLCADARARVLSEGVLGGRVINIDPGKDRSRRPAHGDEIGVVEAPDLSDVMQEASKALQEIRESNGSITKLLKSPEAHNEAVALAKQGQQTLLQMQEATKKADAAFSALKQDADALKKMPLFRGYVEDADALLFRPDCDRDRRVFDTINLFEPGRSILTDEGRQHLNNLAPWFQSMRIKGSELVVVSYAAATPSMEISPAVAQTLTLKQSEAVLKYLNDHVGADRVGWFTSRKVAALGMGIAPPPVPEREPLPADRTEIQIFIPR